MNVSEVHASVIRAYREALAESDFANVKIFPIDRETDDIQRGTAETAYHTSYSRDGFMREMTVHETLYYYASNANSYKLECNEFETLIAERLLLGLDTGHEVTDLVAESGAGILQITYSVIDYDDIQVESDIEYIDNLHF